MKKEQIWEIFKNKNLENKLPSPKVMCEVIVLADLYRKKDGTKFEPKEIFSLSPTGELHHMFFWFEDSLLKLVCEKFTAEELTKFFEDNKNKIEEAKKKYYGPLYDVYKKNVPSIP